jgi:hypothetical protein
MAVRCDDKLRTLKNLQYFTCLKSITKNYMQEIPKESRITPLGGVHTPNLPSLVMCLRLPLISGCTEEGHRTVHI